MHSILIMECNIAFVLVNQSIWENGAYEFGIYNDVCVESIFHYR